MQTAAASVSCAACVPQRSALWIAAGAASFRFSLLDRASSLARTDDASTRVEVVKTNPYMSYRTDLFIARGSRPVTASVDPCAATE